MLIVNTVNAASDEVRKARFHILSWGVALAAVVAALLIVGGMSAFQTAMVICALPFSLVMVLMCFSLLKAVYRDGQREKADVASTVADTPAKQG